MNFRFDNLREALASRLEGGGTEYHLIPARSLENDFAPETKVNRMVNTFNENGPEGDPEQSLPKVISAETKSNFD